MVVKSVVKEKAGNLYDFYKETVPRAGEFEYTVRRPTLAELVSNVGMKFRRKASDARVKSRINQDRIDKGIGPEY